MPEVFLFGATSMLGWSILQARGTTDVRAFCNTATRHRPALVTDAVDLDDEPSVQELFEAARPTLIINCAGVCEVGACERSPAFAHAVNVTGTLHLARHAPAETRIVHLSSDHVFGGDGGPYFEDSPTAPISVYGRTRVDAERIMLARERTLVIRGGLWIGPSATGRVGHLDWLRDRHRRGLPMTIVTDEARSAVWAEDAARRVWDLARGNVVGLRHITATRMLSRPVIAQYLIERFAIGATFATESRHVRPAPHIGRIELATRYTDALATPLPSVVPG